MWERKDFARAISPGFMQRTTVVNLVPYNSD
jgi:hypothetical protein